MENQSVCPICGTSLQTQSDLLTTGDYQIFDCLRCGKYKVSRTLLTALPSLLLDKEKRSLLTYTIRKMQGGKELPFLNSYSVETILQNDLPSLSDQINNLIVWLGDNSSPGEKLNLKIEIFQTIIGAKTADGARLVLDHLHKTRLIEVFNQAGIMGDPVITGLKLTIEGWSRYDNIKRGAIMSRRAFMAMKFGDEDLDLIFANCFKPAVKATGFDLYRLDEQPRAGLIDDRLRVEIRTSRFLISDLTHENAGAYWEAGFAEGLGKPVIYTCEKTKFETQKTHFDTNHHLTIIWDKENLEKAKNQLKATIRATLPDEAILTDSQ